MSDGSEIKIRGGEKAAQYLKDLATKLGKGGAVRVGFLEKATYPDGTPVAAIAAIQEFGAPRAKIPPRPFFRTMISDKEDEWGPAIAGLLKANDYDVEKTLSQAGAAIAGQLRQAIVDMNSPPLSQLTLMLRKMKSEGVEITGRSLAIARARLDAGESVGGISTKPLVETGHMLNSVDFEVKTSG